MHEPTLHHAYRKFKPNVVYPYHYRGENGMSDVRKFKNIVETNNPNIKVDLLDWYAEESMKETD